MVTVNKRFLSLIAVSILLLGLTCTAEASDSAGNDTAAANVQLSNMAKQVRNSLVTLPFLSVFDNLNCIVEDSGTVVLAGHTADTEKRCGGCCSGCTGREKSCE